MLVQEELARVVGTRDEAESGGGSSSAEELTLEEEEATWRRVMQRSFERMDEVALSTCACGSVGGQCGCHPMEVALGGSTAVVAALTPNHIVVANCGDSRAVLCRGGRAIPLSNDHKVLFPLYLFPIHPSKSVTVTVCSLNTWYDDHWFVYLDASVMS